MLGFLGSHEISLHIVYSSKSCCQTSRIPKCFTLPVCHYVRSRGLDVGSVVAIHSFRGGTGKSNLTANLAYCCASQGARVGIIDADIQSPGIHVLFGLGEAVTKYCLNDYLKSECSIKEAVYDVSERLS